VEEEEPVLELEQLHLQMEECEEYLHPCLTEREAMPTNFGPSSDVTNLLIERTTL
jgi:hypothetical protein